MFNRIVACLDGSPMAEQILPYAAEEAAHFNSDLILLHVVQSASTVPPISESQPLINLPTEVLSQYKEAKIYLDRVAQALRKRGLKVEYVIIAGTPGDSIVRYAEQTGTDLLCLATHGRTGLGRLVFGSVADHVIKHLGLPILLIRPK